MSFLRLFPYIQLATYKLTNHDAKLQTFSETAKRFCHFFGKYTVGTVFTVYLLFV